MDKLIVTVTCDSSMSYPGNPRMPLIGDVASMSRQYIDAVNAGASLVHHHGVHYLEHDVSLPLKSPSQAVNEGLILQGSTEPQR